MEECTKRYLHGSDHGVPAQQYRHVQGFYGLKEQLLELHAEDVVEEAGAVTGVERYLQLKPEAPAVEEKAVELSGVEKYMKRQAIDNATGVEKYLMGISG